MRGAGAVQGRGGVPVALIRAARAAGRLRERRLCGCSRGKRKARTENSVRIPPPYACCRSARERLRRTGTIEKLVTMPLVRL